MAKSFYSMVLDHSADAVWSFIRSFGGYAWAGVESETVIEGGKAGDRGCAGTLDTFLRA